MRIARRLLGDYGFKLLKATVASTFGLFRIGSLSYPAANRIDRRFLEIVGFQHGGVFCEVGANDGYSESNTWALERLYGWRGILIEPVPSLYSVCKKVRPQSTVINVALGPRGCEGRKADMYFADTRSTLAEPHFGNRDPAVFAQGNAPYMASPIERGSVLMRELSKILDELKLPELDLLSVDVEGFELGVLDGLETVRHRPKYIIIETDNFYEVMRFLCGCYEFLERLSARDYLFLRR